MDIRINIPVINTSRKEENLFDWVKFCKNPKTICRFFCWLFALVVMACLVSGTYDKDRENVFGQDDNAYRCGVAVSSMAFIVSAILVCFDVSFVNRTSTLARKRIILADVAVSGCFTVLYFVTFCYLANAWSRRNPTHPESLYFGVDNARSAIAFSLFSSGTWCISFFLAFRSHRRKAYELDQRRSFDPQTMSSAPFTSFPGFVDVASPVFRQMKDFSSKVPEQYKPPVF